MPVTRSGVPDARWDEALRRADGHFLQSVGWQRVQSAMGAAVLHGESDGEWMWAAHRGGRAGMRYLYVPCGPTMILAKTAGECLDSLVEAGAKTGATFVRIEPMGAVDLFSLVDRGREVKPVQPQHTWVLDLTTDEAMLRRGLTKGHRGSINAAERKGLTFRRSGDPAEVSVLMELLRLTARRGRFQTAGDRYFRTLADTLMPEKAACLYIAEAEGRPVAAALGFDFNGVRHYAHAGADPEVARRLSAAAPLVWTMILDAKAEGMHTFDFWGVLPRMKKRHSWAGFTQFKQAFGGRMVERAGTWEVTVRKWGHRTHRLSRSLRP